MYISEHIIDKKKLSGIDVLKKLMRKFVSSSNERNDTTCN